MRNAFGRGSLLLLTIVTAPVPSALIARGSSLMADDPAPAGHHAVDPITPELPPAIVAAMQEGKYDEADKALAALASNPRTPDDARSYAALLRGVALRLAKRLAPAREVLSAEMKAHPEGRWAAKVRSELAAVEVADRKFAAAEILARAEAGDLLADARKDRLAEVYQGFADRLLKPDVPTVAADPEGAYALLIQARELAKGQPLRARLLLAMGRASQAANNPGRSIGDYQNYLSEYPQGADRAEVRYQLGEGQLASGQPLPARLTWTDLARDLEKSDTQKLQELRGSALYSIAPTYGIPIPPDDAQMALGVAALKRFLAANPNHKWAVKASFQVGETYLSRGKSEDALAAFTAFVKGEDAPATTDEARRERAEKMMTAQFLVASILQGQGKFDDAIAAYKGYLAKYPNGPQSADAQRAVLDVTLQVAYDLTQRERYADARAAFLAFAAQNPLDGRVPQVLFEVGQAWFVEEKYDDAVAAWETLAGRFPNTEPAAHGEYAIASVLENEKGDPAAAIERYRKVAVEPWASRARERVALMEAKALTVVTERATRSGETSKLKIATRNIETLTFSAYKIDPETYFRKKHELGDVESLDIGLVAPDLEWTADVPGFGKYKPIDTSYELTKLELPGVYVVKVTDDKTLQATTMVLGSDVDAIVKTSRDQVLVFAQDMKTGKGRAGARVLIADETGLILDARTGADGVLIHDWEKPLDPAHPWVEVIEPPAPADDPAVAPSAPDGRPRRPKGTISYLVLDGGDVAGSELAVPDRDAQGLTARGFLYTDRLAYRPGASVEIRGVVREVVAGEYAIDTDSTYSLVVRDAQGRKIVDRPIKLSAFGTFHENLSLENAAPVGEYRIVVSRPGGDLFGGLFVVKSYHLEKIDLEFDLPRTVYYRGEVIKGLLVAMYQYGTPLANRAITLAMPDGRTLSGQTDAEGKYAFELETTGFPENQSLLFQANLPQDNVEVTAMVELAVRAFRIDLATVRDVYLDGEGFAVDLTTLDPQDDPTGQGLSLSLLKKVERNGRATEREVKREDVKTDPKSGKGSVRFAVEDEEGGPYVIRASGTDRFGNMVLAEKALTISGKKDETKLRLLSDRTTFKAGETAEVRLVNRGGAGTALLTWEADRVLSYRLVAVAEGETKIAWPVDGKEFPNFTLAAARMAPSALHEARLDLRVERDLRVTLKPKEASVPPGGEVEVEVTTTDQNGHPVAAEVSLALEDRALIRLFYDETRPIGPFFYDQSRTSAFATESSATFRYTPQTVPVPEAVVEEAAQQLAMAANADSRAEARRGAGAVVSFNGAPAVPAPAAPSAARNRVAPGQNQEAGFGAMGGGMAAARFANPSEKKEQRLEADMARDSAISAMDLKLGAQSVKPDEGSGFASILTPNATPPRERFVETAYWNPAIVTDKDGRATVKFRAPTALSGYRFTARGVTKADTLVGQATADLAIRKDFFVDLKVPSALTQGDKPRFSAEVHHKGAVGTLNLRLTLYAGGREVVMPRSVEVKGDGVETLAFDPFDVPDGDEVRLTLVGTLGAANDELTLAVPIRPWGVQAFASASGTATDSTSAFVSLPPGREYEEPEMLVVISPSLRRMLIDLAMERDAYVLDKRVTTCIWPPVSPTTADRAGELLASAAVLSYLQTIRAADSPDAKRLSEKVRGAVSELITLQNQDGGWPWVAGRSGEARPSDRLTSARAAWALASAEKLGLLPDPSSRDKAATWLLQEFANVEGGDTETRATMLHALSALGRASFEQANALNRVRQGLSNASLAYLALTFANLDRDSMGEEVLNVLAPKAKTEPTEPGRKPRKFWSGEGQLPPHRSDAETTALAASAFARVRPGSPDLAAAVEWLLAHRRGLGWQPTGAKGPALLALASFYGEAQGAEDRYRLVVTVNDQEVDRLDVVGATEGRAIRVPRKHLNPADKNRVGFRVEGRGQFSYAATLTGFTRDFAPDQDRSGKSFVLHRRVYWPGEPSVDGHPLTQGFGVAVRPQTWENTVSQVALGGRISVGVEAYRDDPAGLPSWERDFLVMKDYLPAGTTLVEGSVRTEASSFTVEDGVLTAYFTPDQNLGIIYDVFGYLPGAYRALPASVTSAYDPGHRHLGAANDFNVRSPGEPSTDEYRVTPDELYGRGKYLFDQGRLADAAPPLKALWGGYALRDDVAKDAARMLLTISIREYNPRDVVVYFEVLKEKDPDRVISFDDIKVVGRAYGDLGEHERAFLVWRATTEASYLEDARVGEVLRQRGKTLEGLAYLLDLWREYPSSASIQSDFFGLSQVTAGLAGNAITDPALRSELAAARVTRSDLLLQSIRLDSAFLAQSPTDPLADEASLALVGAFLDLEDFDAVVKLARRYAELYPRSSFQDSFQYSEALGRFHLGEYDRAIAVAETIADATYKDANGVDQPSPNKWQAIYILGQIHDARRDPAKALTYYEQVADRFTDAAGAVKALTLKELKLPEVTVIRPEGPAIAEAGGLRAVPARKPDDKPRPKDDPPSAKLEYRNIAAADVKVYPVDLMKLYLTRRNLDAIAGIDLAGIKPFYETTVKLGDGRDYDDKDRMLDLPVKKEGAYLVMVRGDEQYASGILLVSPLELLVLEQPESGRVRVTVRDARTKAFVPKVQVKVIGSDNPAFVSGETDLRGVFVAEGICGQVTAVARRGGNQYAFHRGTAYVGQPIEANRAPAPSDQPAQENQQLDLNQNVRMQNTSNQIRQIERLRGRYNSQDKGVKAKLAY